MNTSSELRSEIQNLDGRMAPWLEAQEANQLSAGSVRAENLKRFQPFAAHVDWALAAARYAWDESSGRGEDNDQNKAAKMLLRSGLVIVEGAWEEVLAGRIGVTLSLLRLIAEMSDKAIAVSIDSGAARKYLDGKLEWSVASDILAAGVPDEFKDHVSASWRASLGSINESTRWYNDPSHGGIVLAANLIDPEFGPERLRPDPRPSIDVGLAVAVTAINWSQMAMTALENLSSDNPDSRRAKDRVLASFKLEQHKSELTEFVAKLRSDPGFEAGAARTSH